MWPNRPTTVTLGEPVWEIATLFPGQGDWSEEEYFALQGNHLIEFTDGCLELLPVPTMTHQLVLALLLDRLAAFVRLGRRGLVLFAPLKVKLRDGKFREPDILFMFAKNRHRLGEEFWDRADLVMEVVHPDDPNRDYVTKQVDYAEAGIPEYWIADPSRKVVTVLTLREGAYAVHGEFGLGMTATSVLLPGFAVIVSEVFNQDVGE